MITGNKALYNYEMNKLLLSEGAVIYNHELSQIKEEKLDILNPNIIRDFERIKIEHSVIELV